MSPRCMILSSTLFVLAALIAAQPTALAQDNPSALDPKGCAPGERPQPGPRGPKPPATTGQGESTADKLARTDGVICPPDVDREMKAPTPDAGRTPVIPPPGSPGGQKDIEPK